MNYALFFIAPPSRGRYIKFAKAGLSLMSILVLVRPKLGLWPVHENPESST